jgi:hypothetical protein
MDIDAKKAEQKCPDLAGPISTTLPPTDEELLSWGENSFVRLCTFLHFYPDARLHQTIQGKDAARIFGSDKVPDKEVEHEREALATAEMGNYFALHQGAEIYLVYGAEHEFKSTVEKLKNPPSLVSVRFTDLEANSDELWERFGSYRVIPLSNHGSEEQFVKQFLKQMEQMAIFGGIVMLGGVGYGLWRLKKYLEEKNRR